jgi:hypothetical protein
MTTTQWAELASFGTGLEAEIARQKLDDAGIPALIKSDVSGIFGAAFQGIVPSGVSVSVPEPELARAKEIIG